MSALVSVIVPAYNSAAVIGRCLDSILGQTLKEIEVIIVNDGSEDGSEELLSEYSRADSRVKILTIAHSGQGLAKNAGIKAARGEFIGFADSDDTIEPDMYRTMLGAIGDCDMCQCNEWMVTVSGEKRLEFPGYSGIIEVSDTAEYMDEFLFTQIHSHGCCNKLIRKSFLDRYSLEFGDNSEVYAEDLYLNINIAKHLKKIAFIKTPLYNYYMSPSSHSNSYTAEKAEKLCRLFSMVMEDKYRLPLSKLAAVTIMVNLSGVESGAERVLLREDLRGFLRDAAKAFKKPHQKALTAAMLAAPMPIKRLLIKKYYGRYKREL